MKLLFVGYDSPDYHGGPIVNPAALAAAIVRVLKMPDRGVRMAENARSGVWQFTWIARVKAILTRFGYAGREHRRPMCGVPLAEESAGSQNRPTKTCGVTGVSV